MAEKITYQNGKLMIPDQPIITYIEGDGMGVDITPPVLKIMDAAVQSAYRGQKKIHWKEIYAGEKAFQQMGFIVISSIG